MTVSPTASPAARGLVGRELHRLLRHFVGAVAPVTGGRGRPPARARARHRLHRLRHIVFVSVVAPRAAARRPELVPVLAVHESRQAAVHARTRWEGRSPWVDPMRTETAKSKTQPLPYY